MTAKICNYYVTLKCNDACEFDTIWQNEAYQKIRESEYQTVLRGLSKQGVGTINIIGGEPLLREDLPSLLAEAKQLKFSTQLTTNGILYQDKARALAGLVDLLFFSLDYPIGDMHDRSRGVECFQDVVKSIKLAQEIGQRPIINFTLTRDSVLYIPEMIDLAEKLKVLVYLRPVYDFHGTQGFEEPTLAHLKYYFKRRSVLLNLAALEFVKAGGNKVYLPRCRAKETTVTVLPDGQQVSPCFFNQKGRQGREDICSSCMRWPYMLPSFAKGLDKYFWLDQYSKFINQRKGARI